MFLHSSAPALQTAAPTTHTCLTNALLRCIRTTVNDDERRNPNPAGGDRPPGCLPLNVRRRRGCVLRDWVKVGLVQTRPACASTSHTKPSAVRGMLAVW